MKRNRIILSIIFVFSLLYSGVSFSQEQREIDNKLAITQIKELKEGMLFVMLESQNKSIDKMDEMGYKKLAKIKREKVESNNLQIIFAFENRFDFCRDIYYFYSADAEDLKKGDFTVLMNKDQKPVSPNISGDYFIINSFNIYFESMQVNQKGFSINDRNFNQLKKPFPYYIAKKEGSLILKRSYDNMAKKLNEKLWAYYSRYYKEGTDQQK